MFKPKFTVSPKILNNISGIAEIKAVVERSKVLPLNEAQLKRQAIIRMAHTSTSIEGNKLAEFQVGKVLSGGKVFADTKSIQEVKNYQQGLEKIKELAYENKIITLDQILTLHRVLMKKLLDDEKTGRFRTGSIFIIDAVDDKTEKVRFEGPNPQKVPFLVNELLLWLVQAEKESLHPILQAAIFHIQFVTIHPFTDGNGRLTRLITALILYKANWDFRRILVLEDYYNRDRMYYYNALNSVQGRIYHEGEDLTPWMEYFVEGFYKEAKNVLELITAAGFGKTAEEGEQVFLDKDELKLVDFLTTTGRLTSSDVQEILGIAKRTAQLKIKGLVQKELVVSQERGPSTFYTLKK